MGMGFDSAGHPSHQPRVEGIAVPDPLDGASGKAGAGRPVHSRAKSLKDSLELHAGPKTAFRLGGVLWVLSGAPWLWALLRDDGTPACYLHRRFQQYDWQRHNFLVRALMCAGFVAGMPLVLGSIAVRTALHGSRVWRQEGKGRLRQAGEQIALWLTKGVLPLSYYVFEFHRDDARARALDYLYRHETKRGVYPILRWSFASAETTEALRNKALFAQRCQQHGIPAIPVLFTAVRGEITRLDMDEPGLPRCSLFLKPLSGAGGRGAAVWTYAGNGSYWNASAGALSDAALIDHLAKLSQREAYVGRAYVSNHPVIAEVSSGALCTVRVLTCLDENNMPEATHAVLRMARTQGIAVDNFHAGGIAARVGLETGLVGMATDLGKSRHTQWWETHPTTGAKILGRQIPMWDQVIELACRAHAAFADQVAVGWDVAVLKDGPQLVEGNKGPDLDIIQRTSREPIGNSRFGVLLAHHLRRALTSADTCP